jgi:4-amino-4-deoxy-L-arabinose transferase-like glycosyltransferase
MTEGKKLKFKDFLQKYPDFWAWVLVLVIVLFTIAVRARLLGVPLERDEAEYAYSARLLLKGIPLYTESIEFLKLPGLYAVYALILAVFGNSVTGIHLGLLVVNTATIILMFLLGKRLFGSSTGVMVCAGFAVLSISRRILGLATNAEPLLLLPAIGGILLMLRGVESQRQKDFFFSGFLLGLAFVIKQPAIFFIAFAILYIVYSYYKKRSELVSHYKVNYLLFLLGLLIPFGMICIYLFFTGVFDEFFFWTIKFALIHGSALPFFRALDHFRGQMSYILSSSFMIWGSAGVGLTALLWDKKARSRSFFVITFFLFSFLAVSMGSYFRPHYFILILPAIALLAGLGISSIAGLFSNVNSAFVRTVIPVVLSVVIISSLVFAERVYLFQLSPEGVSRAIYGTNPFIEAIEIAKYIKERTSPDDRIAVIGSEPEIFFYADRQSATKYIVMYTLTGEHKYGRLMQQEMIDEIESAKPKYLVFVRVSMSWLLKQESEMLIFDWIKRYVPENYEIVGKVDILLPKPTEYYWGEEAVKYKQRSKYWISIFKRKL